MIEDLTNTFVLHSLWKKGSLFSTQISLLDTVFYNPFREDRYKWLFMDKNGYVKKKNSYN